MTRLEIMKAQKLAAMNAIEALGGSLNKQGLTLSFDTPEIDAARVALKKAYMALSADIFKIENPKS